MTYTKNEMRKAYIARLQQLDLNTRIKEERRLVSRLYDQPEWVSAKTVALTLSQSFEVDTVPLILHARHKGQTVVVPRTLPHRQMEFVAIDEDTTFEETYFGVLEPVGGTVIPAEKIDLMVIPGVAFTTAGKRLGFGGGYYDRYLANYQGATVALALTTQVAADDEWEEDPFDVRVNKVVTVSEE